ncbi:hypothetical protein PGB90_007921 [Kerria lacca]
MRINRISRLQILRTAKDERVNNHRLYYFKIKSFKKFRRFNIVRAQNIDNLPDYIQNRIANSEFVPIISVDVERSIFIFRNILTDNRVNFDVQNSKINAAINYFYNLNKY